MQVKCWFGGGGTRIVTFFQNCFGSYKLYKCFCTYYNMTGRNFKAKHVKQFKILYYHFINSYSQLISIISFRILIHSLIHFGIQKKCKIFFSYILNLVLLFQFISIHASKTWKMQYHGNIWQKLEYNKVSPSDKWFKSTDILFSEI